MSTNKKISELPNISASGDLASTDIVPVVDVGSSTTKKTTLSVLTDYFSNFISSGGGSSRHGYEYYSDNNLASNPLTLLGGEWTDITNNGQSSSSNTSCRPAGVTRIWDVNNNQIKFDELSIKDTINFRLGFDVTPTVNETAMAVRIFWTALNEDGTTAFTFTQQPTDIILENGAGTSHDRIAIIPVYVGDEVSKRGYGKIQLNPNTESVLTKTRILSIVAG